MLLSRPFFNAPPSDSETPSTSFNLQKMDLNEFLSASETEFKKLLGHSINLRYSLRPNAPQIDANQELLRELMAIFLANAKKSMPHGGQLLLQTSEVVLPATETPFPEGQAGSNLMLAISDSGNGMPTETLTKTQQLFTNQWSPQGRFFLGLKRAKEILDIHNARVLPFSQMIRGTTFKIYFPLQKSGGNSATPVSSTRGTETLLFVEDDAMIRHIYTRYLRQRGYNVLEAQHGKEAFDVYENYQGHIHMMITDVVMPELNGRQLGELVSMRHPQLKVLYISGFTRDAILQRGILRADMPFLEKPFGREELAMRVRQLLDISRSPPIPSAQ